MGGEDDQPGRKAKRHFLVKPGLTTPNHTWSYPELNRMLAYALEAGREDYITILYLGRYAGLRIHECFRIDTATATQAVKETALTIKGKGGWCGRCR